MFVQTVLMYWTEGEYFHLTYYVYIYINVCMSVGRGNVRDEYETMGI